jgi:hypothetical protein
MSNLNVVIVLNDARTIAFQSDSFHAACHKVTRMSKDSMCGIDLSNPVFMARSDEKSSIGLNQYSVGEMIREVA